MKKIVSAFICVILLLFTLCSCSSEPIYGLSEGCYMLNITSDTYPSPSIDFDLENNTFTFNYDILSSYFSHGTFSISDGKVIAKTDDGKYTYIFEITDNDTITFIQNGSSEIKITDAPDSFRVPQVFDGAEFKFLEE